MTANGDSKPYGIIYCITHLSTGRVYIGQTVQSVQERWVSHKSQTYCVLLHRAIKKYGADAFSVQQIDVADCKDELDTLEVFYIEIYGATKRANGFNLMSGGSFGKHSDESKKKMSVSVRKAYENPEFKAKLIAAKLGVKHAPERVAKVALANTGKIHSVSTREKIASIVRASWESDVFKKKVSEGQRLARQDVKYLQRVSENTKTQWADPTNKEMLKAAQAAGTAAFWADPVKRAARIAKRRATITAKKATQI